MTLIFDKPLLVNEKDWKIQPFDFYTKKFNGKPSPGWVDIILSGNTALTLVNAKADGLNYLKLFGGTEQLPETYLDTVTLDGACEQRNLPIGYTEVEYLESTGTQYIDTGYKSSNNTKVKAQISCPNVGTFVFGSRNGTSGDNQKRFGLFFNTTWNPQYANQSLSPEEATSVNTIYNVEISKDGFIVDGQSLSTFYSVTFTGDYNMYLFANNTEDTTIGYGSCKIYGFEIYTNGTLEHKYIPAKNSSNVLGMYDTVTGTFFTNAGTGTFTAGTDVTTPTPATPIDIVCNNGVLGIDNQGNITVTGTTETVEDSLGNTATAQNLLAVGSYKDTQEVLSGAVTRNVGIKVLNGTEDWSSVTVGTNQQLFGVDFTNNNLTTDADAIIYNNYFQCIARDRSLNNINDGQVKIASNDDVFGNAYARTYSGGNWTSWSQLTTDTVPGFSEVRPFSDNDSNMDSVWDGTGVLTTILNFKYLRAPSAGYCQVIGVMYKKSNTNHYWFLAIDPGLCFAGSSNKATLTVNKEYSLKLVVDTSINTAFLYYKELGSGNDYTLIESKVSSTYNFSNINQQLRFRNYRGDTPSENIVDFSLSDITISVNDNILFDKSTNKIYFRNDNISNVTTWKQWLASQYANGNALITAYPLETATTESVSGQLLTKSPVTQTAGSISGMTINAVSSSHTTPTPTQPLPINCNNGVVKVNTPALPSGYTRLEYIESTGTQYINTLVPVNDNNSFLITYCALSSGYLVSQGNNALRFSPATNVTWYSKDYHFKKNSDTSVFYTAEFGFNYFTLDGVAVASTVDHDSATGTHVFLFAYNSGGASSLISAQVKQFKIWDSNNVLVRNFIPAKNSSNVIGLYDVVSNTFFTNAGTGTFNAGQEVPYIYTDGTTEKVEVQSENLNSGYNSSNFNVLSDNTISNLRTDTRTTFYFQVQIRKSDSSYESLVSEYISTTGVKSFTFDIPENIQALVFKHNGATNDLQINSTLTLPAGNYTVRFDVEGYNPSIIGGLKLKDFLVCNSPYYYGGSALAERLCAIGDYKDEQNVTSGEVIRQVYVRVLNGTEKIKPTTTSGVVTISQDAGIVPQPAQRITNAYCSHMSVISYSLDPTRMTDDSIKWSTTGSTLYAKFSFSSDTTEIQNWIAQQYQNGTPVIIVYPLATSTTESVTPQTLTLQEGTNIVEITQASMTGLPLEVSYKAGVTVTITEIENAQLSNSVTVTIGG